MTIKRSPVENHVAFFDKDHDGYVTPQETAERFRELGMPGPKRLWTAVAKRVLDKLATQINENARRAGPPGFVPVTGDAIPVKHAALGKHDSDTDAYDASGAFDQRRFDAMFARTDKNRSGTLEPSEILSAAWARRESADGLAFSAGEYLLLWALAKRAGLPLDARLAKAALLGDGFAEIAAARKR